MPSLTPGSLAPDFFLPAAADSSARRLSDLRGQPVLLAFAPPGWNPAQAEAAAQINRILSASGLPPALLRVPDNAGAAQAEFAGEDAPVAVLSGRQIPDDAAALYGVGNQQALFVLDAAGAVRWSYAAAPGVAPQAEDLRAALHALTAAEAAPGAEQTGVKQPGLSRREFLAAALGVALVLAVPLAPARAEELKPFPPPSPSAALPPPPSAAGTVPVTLHVNGQTHTLQLEPRVTLLDALRERIGLTGSKKGCNHGQCGACTVHADGKRINSCLALAVAYQNKPITTIEGLATGDTLHPMQTAFIEHDGYQCGFCTSGQIMSATALLTEPVGPTDAEVRDSMSGNLCRCGAYTNIIAAIQDVRKEGNNAPV